MSRFAAPALAEAADRHLRGDGDAAEFAAAFDAAAADLGQAVYGIACDDAFRTALTWQNPAVLLAVDAIRRDGPHAPRNLRRRHREEVVAKYWQRYCLKNDTVGFFGPICWTELGGSGPIATVRPGAALTRTRKVFLERWGLDALAEAFARGPGVRDWLPVRLAPHLSLRDRVLRRPHHPPQTLPAATAALLTLARRGPRVADLVAALLADPASGFRRAADLHAELSACPARRLRIGFDLPVDLTAEDALREQLAAIGDDTVRERVLGDLATVSDLRDAVAAADGPDALAAAMSALDRRFVELTGREARHSPARCTPAARCATWRRSATWTSASVTRCWHGSRRWNRCCSSLADRGDRAGVRRRAGRPVPRPGGGVGHRGRAGGRPVVPGAGGGVRGGPARRRRHRRVPGPVVDGARPGRRRHRRPGAAVRRRRADRAGRRRVPRRRARLGRRPHPQPGRARVRADEAALLRGDFTVVLGELHVALAAFDTHFFAYGHPDPQRLRDGMRADLPGGRVRLLPPVDWPRTPPGSRSGCTGPPTPSSGSSTRPAPTRTASCRSRP